MNIRELRKITKGLPGDMQVLIPTSMEFDGIFYSPCIGESGEGEVALDEDGEELEDCFILAPHGFYDEPEEGDIIPELN